ERELVAIKLRAAIGAERHGLARGDGVAAGPVALFVVLPAHEVDRSGLPGTDELVRNLGSGVFVHASVAIQAGVQPILRLRAASRASTRACQQHRHQPELNQATHSSDLRLRDAASIRVSFRLVQTLGSAPEASYLTRS